jgi:hypothetical protein
VTYRGAQVAEALADVLKTSLAETFDPVAVFAIPPRTFNPPCVIVRMPDLVEPGVAAMGVDRVSLGVLCVVGMDAMAQLFELLTVVRNAIRSDRSLRGTAQAADPQTYRNFGSMTVGGADYLVAEVFLTINA